MVCIYGTGVIIDIDHPLRHVIYSIINRERVRLKLYTLQTILGIIKLENIVYDENEDSYTSILSVFVGKPTKYISNANSSVAAPNYRRLHLHYNLGKTIVKRARV